MWSIVVVVGCVWLREEKAVVGRLERETGQGDFGETVWKQEASSSIRTVAQPAKNCTHSLGQGVDRPAAQPHGMQAYHQADLSLLTPPSLPSSNIPLLLQLHARLLFPKLNAPKPPNPASGSW